MTDLRALATVETAAARFIVPRSKATDPSRRSDDYYESHIEDTKAEKTDGFDLDSGINSDSVGPLWTIQGEFPC
jgi:hypothetical protein